MKKSLLEKVFIERVRSYQALEENKSYIAQKLIEHPNEDLNEEDYNILKNIIDLQVDSIIIWQNYLSQDDIQKLVMESVNSYPNILFMLSNIDNDFLKKAIGHITYDNGILEVLEHFKDVIDIDSVMECLPKLNYDDSKLSIYSIFKGRLSNEQIVQICTSMDYDDRKSWLFDDWIKSLDVVKDAEIISQYIKNVNELERELITERVQKMKYEVLLTKYLKENLHYDEKKINRIICKEEIVDEDTLAGFIEYSHKQLDAGIFVRNSLKKSIIANGGKFREYTINPDLLKQFLIDAQPNDERFYKHIDDILEEEAIRNII